MEWRANLIFSVELLDQLVQVSVGLDVTNLSALHELSNMVECWQNFIATAGRGHRNKH